MKEDYVEDVKDKLIQSFSMRLLFYYVNKK